MLTSRSFRLDQSISEDEGSTKRESIRNYNLLKKVEKDHRQQDEVKHGFESTK